MYWYVCLCNCQAITHRSAEASARRWYASRSLDLAGFEVWCSKIFDIFDLVQDCNCMTRQHWLSLVIFKHHLSFQLSFNVLNHHMILLNFRTFDISFVSTVWNCDSVEIVQSWHFDVFNFFCTLWNYMFKFELSILLTFLFCFGILTSMTLWNPTSSNV